MQPNNEMTERYLLEQFDNALNSPLPWLRSAESLRQAADRFGWQIEGKNQTPGAFLIYRFLFGLAMENLFKGILIAYDYKPYCGKKLKKLLQITT